MPNSPLLFGPNNISNNLQNSILLPNGQQLLNSGPVNLIANSTFENQLTTGWNLGVISSLTNGIPTGTISNGGTTGLTLAIDTSNNLNGLASLSLASSGATVSGNCLYTSTFSVLPAFRAQVMTYKFYYKVQSGASNANFSGTSSNSYGVAAYDVTNSAWLGVAGNFSMTQNSGVGVASGTFQTASNTAQIQFVVYCNVATAGAVTMIFDDFFVGPQTAPIGPVVTDWVSWTPTGTWVSNATYVGYKRRVGDKGEYQVTVTTSAAPTATQLFINMPSGEVIDTAKLPGTANNPVLGFGAATDTSAATYPMSAAYNTSTQITVSASGAAGTYVNSTGLTNAIPFTFANTDTVNVTWSVPIVGWSSNVQMSNDTDTRVISAQATLSATSGNFTDNVDAKVPINSVVADRAGMIDTSNNRFNIGIAGDYVLAVTLNWSTSTGPKLLSYKINGGSFMYIGIFPSGDRPTASVLIPNLKPGDYIEAWARQNSGGNATLAAGAANTAVSLFRLSGPAVIAATESVNCKYTNTAGTSIANSGFNNVPFATKIFDSHNAWNGTQYVVPVSGKYRISSTILFDTSVYVVGNTIQTGVFVNTVANTYGNVTSAATTTSIYMGPIVTTTISCNAGDLIEIRASNNRTAGATLLSTGAGFNHIEIERIGN